MNKSILIFIITYFASYRLEKVYKKIPFKKIFLKNFRVKVLISDDKSADDTIKIAKKITCMTQLPFDSPGCILADITIQYRSFIGIFLS